MSNLGSETANNGSPEALAKSVVPLIRSYLIVCSCSNAFFVSSIWIFFWLKHVDYEMVGNIAFIAFTIGWVAEIPSGVLADRFGRSRLVGLGLGASAFGIALEGLATHAAYLCVGESFYLIGFAFISGALDAWLYDAIPESNKKQVLYQEALGRGSQVALWADVAAITVGVAIYQIWPRGPFFLQSLLFAIGACVAFQLPDTHRTSASRKLPLIRLVRETCRAITPSLGALAIFAVSVSGIYYAYAWGYIRPAIVEQSGMPPPVYAGLQVVSGVGLGFIVRHFSKTRALLGDYAGLGILTFIFGASFLWLSFFNTVLSAAITIMLSTLVGNMIFQWSTFLVNQRTESNVRASVLSTISAGIKLPYCLFAVYGGALLSHGRAAQLYLLLAVVTWIGGIGSLSLFAWYERRRS